MPTLRVIVQSCASVYLCRVRYVRSSVCPCRMCAWSTKKARVKNENNMLIQSYYIFWPWGCPLYNAAKRRNTMKMHSGQQQNREKICTHNQQMMKEEKWRRAKEGVERQVVEPMLIPKLKRQEQRPQKYQQKYHRDGETSLRRTGGCQLAHNLSWFLFCSLFFFRSFFGQRHRPLVGASAIFFAPFSSSHPLLIPKCPCALI